MKIRNLKIGLRLSIGFAIIIAFAIVIGITALRNISSSTILIQNMYKHPLAVSKAVRDINANVIAIHRSMKDVALSENEEELLQAAHLVEENEKIVYDNFEIVFSQFLGNMSDVENAHKSFRDWKPIREEVIYLWHQGRQEEAIAITKGKGAVHVEKVLSDVRVMMEFANAKADSYYEETYNAEEKAYNSMLALLGVVVILSFLIVILITRSLVKPIQGLNAVTNQIQAGKLDVRHPTRSKDELSTLARSFNKMADSIETRNNVLKGLAEISSVMHGKEDLNDFAETLLLKFKELTKAQMLSFYILNRDENQFIPLKSIGASHDLLQPFTKENAPGDFGNVLHTKKIFQLSNLSKDTTFLYKSVIGDIVPKELITIPIIEMTEVVALISCANVESFSVDSRDIIQKAQPIISASFATLLANRKTQKYSQQLAAINQELEAQSEELKTQAEELRKSGDNLHEQNIELEMQRRQVEEANRLKSEFLSNMSHELRTPLNSINALSNVLINQSSSKLDNDEAGYLKIIERNGKRLLALINDILDLSKVEAGKMDVHLQSFSINRALKNIAESLESLAFDKGMSLKLNLADDVHVMSDEHRLTQVITNVLGNAIKFTEEGGVSISTIVSEQEVQIRIKDTGIGIDKDVLPYIFHEFRQADGTTSRAYEGTGLGLAIANKIIHALQGNIDVESTLGVGSVFTISIPLEHKENARSTSKLNSEVVHDYQERKSILVVDDDEEMVLELSDKLSEEGYVVIRAFSGKEALDLAVKHNPFVITLDILMPEMDGWEVLQKLQQKEATKDIPVIIVSKSEDMATSAALGAMGYIQKPVSKEQIISEIQKISRSATKIAIVDDSEVDRMQLSRILEREDLESTILVNGEQCINYLETETPDVLILDLMMQGMDGFQVLKEVRSRPQTRYLPVIVVTAKELRAEEKKFLNKQAATLISKATMGDNVVTEIYKMVRKFDNPAIENSGTGIANPKKILIVEDNEVAVVQIKKVLEKNDIHVDHAINGNVALDYMKQNIPDGIILDLMMPEMDGFELLEKMRSSEPTRNIPVLVLTAKTLTKAELSELSSNNVHQLLQKGDVNLNELIRRIDEMLGTTIPKKEEPLIVKKVISGEPTIVVVEDNPDNQATVKAILGNKYKIIEAMDGEEGIEKILKELPDLVLLDISLPGKDGFEVIRELRGNTHTSTLPVIALTAKAMKGDREMILDAGCNEYISKPIDPEVLRSKIDLYI